MCFDSKLNQLKIVVHGVCVLHFKMNYVKILMFLLRLHMLLPPKHIQKIRFLDTFLITSLVFAPWTFMCLSIAYCYAYRNTASLVDLTDVMTTIFICIIVVSNNAILASKKFQIRSLLAEMKETIIKRKFKMNFCLQEMGKVDYFTNVRQDVRMVKH